MVGETVLAASGNGVDRKSGASDMRRDPLGPAACVVCALCAISQRGVAKSVELSINVQVSA